MLSQRTPRGDDRRPGLSRHTGPSELMAAARTATGLDDFGEAAFIEP